MKHTPPPPLPSDHRLARLGIWLALTVAWFTAHVLVRIAPRAAARELARYATWTRALLIARALKRVPTPRRPPHPLCYDPNSYKRRLSARRLVGGAVRRALKGRTLIDQARALYAAITNAERWIARIVRRLQRRFTKLRRRLYPVRATPPLRAASAAPDLADSS